MMCNRGLGLRFDGGSAEQMDPDPDEVQVAWENGTVENVRCRELKLGESVIKVDYS